jgi:FMN phosphatase YigB (HAD superfamily)
MMNLTAEQWEAVREATPMDEQLWFVFDLDGTLADVTHRLRYAEEKDWVSFNMYCIHDTPKEAECYLARMVHSHMPHHRIMIITGRSDDYRPQTEEWLVKHGIPYDELHMRAVGDHRPDTIVKGELATDAGLPFRNISFVLEDRDKMVAFWRKGGLTCFQNQPGAY